MAVKPRYFKWDYDGDTVTEYERQGECNRCGQCCMALIKYHITGKRAGRAAPMGDGMGNTGVWSEIKTGKMRRFIKLPEIAGDHTCPAYKFSGCTAHGEKSLRIGGNLALCAAWPVIPEHVAAFEECSYTFVEIGRWKISELQQVAE